jgi:hypothetical protein
LPTKDTERDESLSSDHDCLIYAVAGPYCFASSLDYTALDEFLNQVEADQPDVVIFVRFESVFHFPDSLIPEWTVFE